MPETKFHTHTEQQAKLKFCSYDLLPKRIGDDIQILAGCVTVMIRQVELNYSDTLSSNRN
jgi:hypothetical protein